MLHDPNNFPESLPIILPYSIGELWTAEKKRKIKSDACFATLRVLKHKATGLTYYDINAGRLNSGKHHFHYGFALNQARIFVESRGVVHWEARDISSVERGNIHRVEMKRDDIVGLSNLIFSVAISISTKESRIARFEFASNMSTL